MIVITESLTRLRFCLGCWKGVSTPHCCRSQGHDDLHPLHPPGRQCCGDEVGERVTVNRVLSRLSGKHDISGEHLPRRLTTHVMG